MATHEEYDWPLNLPELRAAARGAVTSGGGTICLADVAPELRHGAQA